MAFIFGGLIFLMTVILASLIVWADMMQPAPQASNQRSPWPVLIIGSILAISTIASHWWHFSW